MDEQGLQDGIFKNTALAPAELDSTFPYTFNQHSRLSTKSPGDAGALQQPAGSQQEPTGRVCVLGDGVVWWRTGLRRSSHDDGERDTAHCITGNETLISSQNLCKLASAKKQGFCFKRAAHLVLLCIPSRTGRHLQPDALQIGVKKFSKFGFRAQQSEVSTQS